MNSINVTAIIISASVKPDRGAVESREPCWLRATGIDERIGRMSRGPQNAAMTVVFSNGTRTGAAVYEDESAGTVTVTVTVL